MAWRFDTLSYKIKKIVRFVKFGLFLKCESTCDLIDVTASIYDIKIHARPFDTTHDILRCLSFVKSLFKDRNAPFWRIGNRRVQFWKNQKKVSSLSLTSRRPSCTVGPLTNRMSLSSAVLVAAKVIPTRVKVNQTRPIISNSVLIRSKI